jgi:glutamate synthase (NADPH) small chain
MSSTVQLSKRVGPFPFPKSNPERRKGTFSEVQLPYTVEEAMKEADRCARCLNPVCIAACPVELDVRGMCDAVARGDFETAYRRIRETNALLGVTARCCPQMEGLCEDACVWHQDGDPVSIGMIQRFVSDWEQNLSKQPDPPSKEDTGRRITIVGAGPAGLAAAELLRRYGHNVTILEELSFAGGTAWYGIPDYHLPKDVLQYEIKRIENQGVVIKTGVKVEKDISLAELVASSDAVLIATGSKDVVKVDLPGRDSEGIFDAYQFLEDVFSNGVSHYIEHPSYELGKEILVIGGGDSALDAARTALRLSQGTVTIVYRRTEAEMPADPFIISEAKEEKIQFKFLSSPKSFNSVGGKVRSVTMLEMKLGEPDKTGRRSPEPTGAEFDMTCDSVLLALGRGPNSFIQNQTGMKVGKSNSIVVDGKYRTSFGGVFAAGDVTTGETLVVKAMAQGREAAQRIHEYVMGLDEKHVSLFDQYFGTRATREFYERMLLCRDERLLPPP